MGRAIRRLEPREAGQQRTELKRPAKNITEPFCPIDFQFRKQKVKEYTKINILSEALDLSLSTVSLEIIIKITPLFIG